MILGAINSDWLMPAFADTSMASMWSGAGDLFGSAFTGFEELFALPEVFAVIFTLLFVDFFDTVGTGIAIGFVFYPIIMIAQGRAKEVNWMMYGLSVLFIVYFVIKALG